MMLGAGETLPPLFNTISLRDDRQSPEILASTRARYPISGYLRGGPVRDRGLIWALPRRFLSPPPTLQQIRSYATWRRSAAATGSPSSYEGDPRIEPVLWSRRLFMLCPCNCLPI